MSRRVMAWSLTSQVISSASNFILTLLVARALTPAQFGGFALAFSAYVFAQLLLRSSVGQTLILQPSSVDRSLSVYLHVAVTAGAIAGMVGLLVRMGDVLSLMLLLSIPVAVTQDWVRYRAFAAGRADLASRSDLVWLIVMGTSGAVAVAVDPPAAVLVGLWGAGALVATLPFLRSEDSPCSMPVAVRWVVAHRATAGPLAMESLVFLLSGQALLILVGAIAGLGALGQIKAAQVLMSPVISLFGGAAVAATVLARRRLEERGWRPTVVMLVRIATALALVAMAWSLVMRAVPETLGVRLLGPNWNGAHELVLVVGLGAAVSAFSASALIMIRVVAGARASLTARLTTCWAEPALGGVGAGWGAATGAVVGMLISQLISLALWTLALRRLLVDRYGVAASAQVRGRP